MSTTAKAQAVYLVIPHARLINHSLFEKDQYDEKSTPSYKVEIAIPKDHPSFKEVADAIWNFACDTWGDNVADLNIDGGPTISGIIDGEFLKAKRERNQKPGDAYAGQWVIRASTAFNRYGDDGPGGIAVFDEDVKPIEALNRDKIYRGCYVSVKVSLGSYEDDKTGNHGIKCYLVAVQKIGDGEPLSSPADHSSAFKPVGRAAAQAAGETAGRRTRKQ